MTRKYPPASHERGAVLVETILSLAIIVPLFSGMLMIAELSQERALISQALRSSTRPVSFFQSIGITSSSEEDPSELEEIYSDVCSLLELSFEAARLHPSDYAFTLEVSSVVPREANESSSNESVEENGETPPITVVTGSTFLAISAKRRHALNVPFYGSVGTGGEFRTLFPIRLDTLQLEAQGHIPGEKYICGQEEGDE